jgi:hypothetical protein
MESKNKTKHTPGPWKVAKAKNGRRYVYSTDNFPVISWPAYRSGAEREANARLIASAPDLLAERDALLKALKEIKALAYQAAERPQGGELWTIQAEADDAIALLEGK